MIFASGDSDDIIQAGWRKGLAEVVCTPTGHGPVAPHGETILHARGYPGDGADTRGRRTLWGFPPTDNGAIALEGKAVITAGGDRDDIGGERGRHGALAEV